MMHFGQDTFTAVAQSAAPRLFRVAQRMCRTREDAEDLVQETLMQAFRKWHQFEGRANPSTWLYTIAARLCRRSHRPRAGAPARLESLSDLQPTPSDPVLAIPDRGDGPLETHLRREAERAVAEGLARLPAQLRLPLILADIAELSTPEIGRVLGLKEATVRTRVHRGRLAIRRALLQRLPTRVAPPVDHDRQLCLDLLQAKQEALDRHADLPISHHELCARCRSVFAALDLGREVCAGLGSDELPDAVRALLAEHAQRDVTKRPRLQKPARKARRAT